MSESSTTLRSSVQHVDSRGDALCTDFTAESKFTNTRFAADSVLTDEATSPLGVVQTNVPALKLRGSVLGERMFLDLREAGDLALSST
mmetsp:Transcript_56145/g.87425  ORF Transcript_56145/g.87425 Transcript_56145/m.87425 type:complete len:88 (-) Transcript_56145:318-581(-)|eukprot:CAMPEP_0169062414 /NCGR_PEP_ID=MMETSP1015-20121227/672_1 /TAXON_ID=342587 /ORGANISM="Karlodinium micrum, Strain CCMP2283" /LENGTH=87 /DNA_ID=CAMNT_0009120549 /DNA_START=335 /DNA_END=598 /DNA_ORIENTATION=-